MIIDDDISLLELSELISISRRSLDLCYNSGLYTLSDILHFFKKNNSFYDLRYCDDKLNMELIAICKKYAADLLEPNNDEAMRESTPEILKAFDPYKKNVLNKYVEYLLEQLSVRAKNGVLNLFGAPMLPKDVLKYIFDPEFKFYNIKNIGSKTVLELLNFKHKLSYFIHTLQFLEKEQLHREYARILINANFTDLPEKFDESANEVFDENDKIKLFKLIDILITNNLLFKENEKRLFYQIYSDPLPKKIELIAKECGLGTERTRQISIALKNKIKSYFGFTADLSELNLPGYYPAESNDFIIIDTAFTKQINHIENVIFNESFYAEIFCLVFKNNLSVFSNNEIYSIKNSAGKRKRFKNYYLINNEIFKGFDFTALINDINGLLNKKFIPLCFDDYMRRFLKTQNENYISRIKKICCIIFSQEFGLIVNNEGYLLFSEIPGTLLQ